MAASTSSRVLEPGPDQLGHLRRVLVAVGGEPRRVLRRCLRLEDGPAGLDH